MKNTIQNTLTTFGFTFNADEPVYPDLPVSIGHDYSDTEQANLRTTAEFHKNFSSHDFEANALLVAENIHVRSNGVEFFGRDKFVERIKRFIKYFPDVAIQDFAAFADGNTTIIRIVVTGTMKSDYPGPNGTIKATGQKIKLEGVEIFTFNEEGKVSDLVTVQRGDQLHDQISGKEFVD